MTPKEAKIEAYWTSDKTKCKITGAVINREATISIYKEEYIRSSPNKFELGMNRAGHIYLAPDGQKLSIMTMKEGNTGNCYYYRNLMRL